MDIGLSAKPDETAAAIANGFNVYGFELMPDNFRKMKDTLRRFGKRVRYIQLVPHGDSGWKLPTGVDQELRFPPLSPDGHGFAYVFNAGVDSKSGTTYVPRVGTPASLVALGSDQSNRSHLVGTPLVALEFGSITFYWDHLPLV